MESCAAVVQEHPIPARGFSRCAGLALAMLACFGGSARAETCPDTSYPYLGSLIPPHWASGVRTRHTTTLPGTGTTKSDDCSTDSSLQGWLDTGANGLVGTAEGNALASLSQGKLHASDQGRATNLYDYSHAKATLADRLTITWDGTGTPPTPVLDHPDFSYVPVTFTMHVDNLMDVQVDAGLTTAQLMNQRLTESSHAILGFLDESGLVQSHGTQADFTRRLAYDFYGDPTDDLTASNYGNTGSTFNGSPLANGASTTFSVLGAPLYGVYPAEIVYVQDAVIGQPLDIDASLESVLGKPSGANAEPTSQYILGTLDLNATFSADLPAGYHLHSESGVFLPEPKEEALEACALSSACLLARRRRGVIR